MEAMPVLDARCGGLDVHLQTVVANGKAENDVRTFRDSDRLKLQLIARLKSLGCKVTIKSDAA